MYFPYLRGKQNEVLAIRDLSALLSDSGLVTPIVEPVRESQNNNLVRIAEAGVPLVVIDNPEKGDFSTTPGRLQSFISERLAVPNVVVGFIIGPQTNRGEVEGFARRNEDHEIALIHFGTFADPDFLRRLGARYNVFLEGRSSLAYRGKFPKGSRVLLEDPYLKRPRNEAYPPNEFFSDTHTRFEREGVGFGDFSIQGNHYSESGGQALAVAIHYINREDDGSIWIRHFISDRTKGLGVDTAGKFMEALRKTVRFILSGDNCMRTEACGEYEDLHQRQHFPGLGIPKKLSIKRHIEVVEDALRR